MQSCPNEILDQIVHALVGDHRWENSARTPADSSRLVPPDILNLALACRVTAQATESHRFRTVILENSKRNKALAQCVQTKPMLLSQTANLIWDSDDQSLRGIELLEWMTSSTADPVIASLTAVRSVHIRQVSLKPATFASWYAVRQIFASVHDLQIYPYVIIHGPSDLFSFLDLFPNLENLLLKLTTQLMRWNSPADTQPLAITPPSSPHARPLRTLDLQTQAQRPSHLGLLPRMNGMMYQMSHWVRIHQLTSLAMDMRDPPSSIMLLSHCVDSLRELDIHDPYRPYAIGEEKARFPVKLSQLRLIHFRGIEVLVPTMIRLLRLLLPACERDKLDIRFSGHSNSLYTFTQNFTVPVGIVNVEWKELDETISGSGCRSVRFELSIWVPGNLRMKSPPGPKMFEPLLPRCRSKGILDVDITLRTTRR